MTPLLNFVTGLSAVFLLVSLFVPIIQELLSQALALRARYLRLAIIAPKSRRDWTLRGWAIPVSASIRCLRRESRPRSHLACRLLWW
ncbi:hypothetical protein [Bradyrhizobium sp. BR 10289]|uniref:hypothetical protein n=1 Tax=Bradyrhizobium sp. BR 10289 TaxID=2749993 RepID=UPI001C64B923|nr:hypothetical protein [Bradyrhizobium sp. BR 10289]MBW7971197.1 hypothetical protein [Bradyrhizobium sp. BR 10289]